jgi:cytidine deaminase
LNELTKQSEHLRNEALRIATRSYVPYTGQQEGVIILLENGDLIPGVRVENASFQLTIPALQNALSTMYALQRTDISMIVSSIPFTDSDLAYTGGMAEIAWEMVGASLLLVAGSHIPEAGTFIDPARSENLLDVSREAALNAFIPESDFPVGSAIQTSDNVVIDGCNVEHSDWSKIICAERNVLSTARSYGLGQITTIYVSCPKEPGGTPCGACRQVIVELAPDATVWMDRGNQEPIAMKATELLPGHFTGNVLKKQ